MTGRRISSKSTCTRTPRVAPIDVRIFGGFLEHLGRAVYEGVFDPGNPLSDDRGFRQDVLDALRRLRMPVVRYPGGNFVSAYHWRDGVGPMGERPRRPDFAWRSIETNRFGTDEFMAWCDALGTSPMMAVNLGTGSPAEAAELVEYCNLPAGTSVADQRIANGHAEPYGVNLWCLGNEMDGPWQAGHVPAQAYTERALVASALMKGLDPSIETIACGSSHKLMPSYLVWDRTVLEHCWDRIDYLSAHRYSGNGSDDTASYLGEGVVIDEIIREYGGLFDYVRAIRRSRHRVYLSFDEWNVWYRERSEDGDWREAPHLLEEVYNFEDALVCAQYLHAFLRHADVVKIACLAQIVNVIAPRPHAPRWDPAAIDLLALCVAARCRVRRRAAGCGPVTRATDPHGRRSRCRRRGHVRRGRRLRVRLDRAPRPGPRRGCGHPRRRPTRDRHRQPGSPCPPQDQ